MHYIAVNYSKVGGVLSPESIFCLRGTSTKNSVKHFNL